MHKLRNGVLLNCLALLVLPVVANAAGTYYTGSAYQPVQYRYGQSGSYTTSGYNNARYSTSANSVSGARYNTGYSTNYQNTNATRQTNSRSIQKSVQSNTSKSGFFAKAGITHENAMWKFEMVNVANSVLKYDDVAWNVFDLSGGYVFDFGQTKMQLDAGLKYGLQWGEASMIDDDISKGGYGVVDFWKDTNGDGVRDTLVGSVVGHGLSIGKSDEGDMLGFNVGVGFTDFFKWGNVKITPSVGYRYLKYKLETKNNYGMLMDTVNSAEGCVSSGGESQCGVALLFFENEDDDIPAAIVPANYLLEITGLDGWYINASDTYYYEQTGVSHSYEVAWSGPYVALDMLYDINQYNSVNGRIELGFPGYSAIGDQPYRWDWSHPKSVEDTAGMFSALHVGMAFDWRTEISNRTSLSIGLTYDYYTVSGADSKTYLNKDLYDSLVSSGATDAVSLWYKGQLEDKRDACGGWICESNKEIDSIYKSMGIRVGIDAWF